MSAIKIDLDIDSVKVIVLNDMGNCYSPLFDYEMDTIKVAFDKNNLFLKI